MAAPAAIAGVQSETSTIARGLSELRSHAQLPPGLVQRPGGGRKRTIDKDPTLLRDLEGLVERTTSGAGAPDSPLHWTAKRTRQLARELQGMRRENLSYGVLLLALVVVTGCAAPGGSQPPAPPRVILEPGGRAASPTTPSAASPRPSASSTPRATS